MKLAYCRVSFELCATVLSCNFNVCAWATYYVISFNIIKCLNHQESDFCDYVLKSYDKSDNCGCLAAIYRAVGIRLSGLDESNP